MTRDLTTVDGGATLKEVANLMREQDIGNVLIMDGERLAGIVTDRDIVIRAVAYGHDLGSPVTDYSSDNVFTMDAGSSVQDAAQEMANRQLRRLPITEGGEWWASSRWLTSPPTPQAAPTSRRFRASASPRPEPSGQGPLLYAGEVAPFVVLLLVPYRRRTHT